MPDAAQGLSPGGACGLGLPAAGGASKARAKRRAPPDWANRGRAWQRRRRLVIYLTDAELADVRQLADAWGCKASAAGWAILAERLAKYRRQGAQLGKHGLALAALAGTLRLPVDWRRWQGWHGAPAGLRGEPPDSDA